MNAYIICDSRSGNAGRVADSIASGLKIKFGVEISSLEEASAEKVKYAGIVGLGSEIYFNKHSRGLIAYVRELLILSGKPIFIFSTSVRGSEEPHRALRRTLEEKGARIIGEFASKAFDDSGLLKLFGGINKGRPDSDDLVKAKEFGFKLYTLYNSFLPR